MAADAPKTLEIQVRELHDAVLALTQQVAAMEKRMTACGDTPCGLSVPCGQGPCGYSVPCGQGPCGYSVPCGQSPCAQSACGQSPSGTVAPYAGACGTCGACGAC